MNKANGCVVQFQTCNKLEDYIKEVEICPGEPVESNNNSASKSKSSKLDAQISIGHKTEPVANEEDNLFCEESLHSIKNFTPDQKITKSIKLADLNTLSGLIGNIDYENHEHANNLQPEIIFHTKDCRPPAHGDYRHFHHKERVR